MKETKISQILSRLMMEKKIRVAELARLVNVPQPTVHRIATGACEHPHLASLKPLADFFSITVDQLKGFEPILELERVAKIPLLAWEQVASGLLNHKMHSEWTVTDATIGLNSYALKVKDASMDPVFPRNTILITDPDKRANDRSYVIAKLAHFSEPIFRQLVMDAQDSYLKPLSPDFNRYKMTRLNNNDKILSVVVQAKRDCEE